MDNENELLLVHGKINGRRATMLIDSGSTHDFISQDFVRRHNLATVSSENTLNVTLADGTCGSRPMETVGPVKIVVRDFSEEQCFTVFPLSHYDAILGKPWLTRNNPAINYKTNDVQIHGQPISSSSSGSSGTVCDDSTAESMFISGKQASHALRTGAQGYLAFVNCLQDDGTSARSSPVLPQDEEAQRDITELLNQYADMFPDELPNELPPKRTVDHEIQVEDGSAPPARPAYRLSKPEMDELQAQITELLRKGFLEPSKSPYGAPVFFVKKGRRHAPHGM